MQQKTIKVADLVPDPKTRVMAVFSIIGQDQEPTQITVSRQVKDTRLTVNA